MNNPKLGIGSVQFGMDYGISNKSGRTPLNEIEEILKIASYSNIDLIDTAVAYGNSEEVLGNCNACDMSFKVVTKVTGSNLLEDFNSSLKRLKSKKVYGLLLHSFKEFNDSSYKQLLQIKNEDKAKKIGVSVYNAAEIEFILKNYNIDIIQLPLNIFDRRLLRSASLKKLKNRNVEIHCRSAFLQGLAFMDPYELPSYFSEIRNTLLEFQNTLKSYNISVESACLGFLKRIREIDYIICGVNNCNQFNEIIKAFNSDSVDIETIDKFEIEQERFLNPSLWEK